MSVRGCAQHVVAIHTQDTATLHKVYKVYKVYKVSIERCPP